VKGGQITDAGLQAVTPGVFDAGYVPLPRDAPCGEGDTWSSLYRDIFGPTGQPGSCSFQNSCHGTPGTEAQARGITCMDEKGCRQSFIDTGLVSAGNAAKPENSTLISGLLKDWNPKTGKPRAGIMPREPANFVFPDACIARMEAWIAKGIPAD
jgi:hypothetical protein